MTPPLSALLPWWHGVNEHQNERRQHDAGYEEKRSAGNEVVVCALVATPFVIIHVCVCD